MRSREREPAPSRRVVVTGVGAVTPFGLTVEDSVRRLAQGAHALSPTLALDGLPRRAGAIEDFEARSHFRLPKALKVSDRKTQLGVAAAAMALADSGYPDTPELREELAVLFACAATDLEVDRLAGAVGSDPERRAVDDIPYFAERVLRRLYPLWLLVNLPNMLAAQIGIQVAANGPNHTLLTEWVAGAQAIGEAFLAIRAGEIDAAVAGGAESPLSPVYAGCLERQGLMDLERGDLVLAEAAAALVLEGAGARPRARPLAEVTGYATAAPSALGSASGEREDAAIIRATRLALSMHRASLSAHDPRDTAPIWRVVGFGPPDTDHLGIARRGIGAAFGSAFGREADAVDEISVQGRMGHPLGAAGAVAPALAIAGAACPGEALEHFDLLCSTVGYTGVGCALTLRVGAPDLAAGSPEAGA